MKARNRNILLTGATGYIGGNLIRILKQNDENVYVMVREESNQDIVDIEPDRIYVYTGDVKDIILFFVEKKINTVFHLAAYQVSEHSTINLDFYLQANIVMGTHLLEALKASNESLPKCFISFGTNWQHYEHQSYRAVNLYAATKEAFGKIVDYYADAFKMNAITLELYDTYGEFDKRNKIINLFLRQAKGEILQTTGGEQKIDLLYIEDVIAGCIQALAVAETFLPGTHERYCLSTDFCYSIKEVAAVFEKVFGKSLGLAWGAIPYKEREMWYPYRDGVRLPGWTARYTLEEGLREMKERMSK